MYIDKKITFFYFYFYFYFFFNQAKNYIAFQLKTLAMTLIGL